MWKWKTVCHAAGPVKLVRFTPSAPSASRARDGEPLGRERHRGEVLGSDVVQVARVVARHDERVPSRHRVDVHEAHGALVRVDDRPR